MRYIKEIDSAQLLGDFSKDHILRTLLLIARRCESFLEERKENYYMSLRSYSKVKKEIKFVGANRRKLSFRLFLLYYCIKKLDITVFWKQKKFIKNLSKIYWNSKYLIRHYEKSDKIVTRLYTFIEHLKKTDDEEKMHDLFLDLMKGENGIEVYLEQEI